METFDKAICNRVVNSSADLGCTQEVGEGSKEVAFELLSTISSDHLWNTESGDPMGNKSLSDCLGCDVGDRNGFRPASESINAG